MDEMAVKGLRTLLFAWKEISQAEEPEENLQLLGATGLEDVL